MSIKDEIAHTVRIYRRYRKLKDISKRLGSPIIPANFRGNYGDAMTKGVVRHNNAQIELFDLVETDEDLRSIMERYGGTRETLKLAYKQLEQNVGQWASGIYVPVGALGANTTLHFMLKALDYKPPYEIRNQWALISEAIFEYCQSDDTALMDMYFANYFVDYADDVMENIIGECYQELSIVDSIVHHEDFAKFFLMVAISIADAGAIIQDRGRSKRNLQRLHFLIEYAEKHYSDVREQLMNHQEYTMPNDDNPLAPPLEMNGRWIINSLSNVAIIDFSQPAMRKAAEVLGKRMYDNFISYWD